MCNHKEFISIPAGYEPKAYKCVDCRIEFSPAEMEIYFMLKKIIAYLKPLNKEHML